MIKFKNNTIYPLDELMESVVKYNQVFHNGVYKCESPFYTIIFNHIVDNVEEVLEKDVDGGFKHVYYVHLNRKGVVEIHSKSGFMTRAFCKTVTLFNLDYSSVQEDIEIVEI